MPDLYVLDEHMHFPSTTTVECGRSWQFQMPHEPRQPDQHLYKDSIDKMRFQPVRASRQRGEQIQFILIHQYIRVAMTSIVITDQLQVHIRCQWWTSAILRNI